MPASPLPTLENAPELASRVESWPERAKAALVTDSESFEVAAALLLDVKLLLSEVESSTAPVIQAAHAAHKAALAQRNQLQAPLLEAEGVLKRSLSAYQDAEQKRQREEAARIEAEQKAAEEESRLAEAEELEKAGEHEAAAQVLDEPIVTAPPPAPAASAPKVKGVSMRETWSAEVVDLLKLVKAVAAGTVPLAAVQANGKVLNEQARSLKAELRWPGIKVHRGTSVAAGGR